MRLMIVVLSGLFLLAGFVSAAETDTPKAEKFLADQTGPTKFIVGSINSQGLDYPSFCANKENIVHHTRAILTEKMTADHSLLADKLNTMENSVRYFMIACKEKGFNPQ